MNSYSKTIRFIFNKTHRFLPDKLYVRMHYRSVFGERLNLKDPQTFNEIMCWLKLYDRQPEYHDLVDKHTVKKIVGEMIGEDHIIPTLGVWDSAEEIDFEALPESFVLKCTHDSGSCIVCRDKSASDLEAIREKIRKSLKEDHYKHHGREWVYKGLPKRVIAEPFLSDEKAGPGLIDYKFFCTDGIPRFLYTSQGLEDHTTARISFLTLDWQFAPWRRTDYSPLETLPEKPSGLDEMIRLSKLLSAGKRFVRVDFYQVNGKVLFSELTFTPASGAMTMADRQMDLEIGKALCFRTE